MTTITFQEWLLVAASFLPRLIMALVLFVAGLVVSGWLGKALGVLLRRRKTDPEVILLLQQLTRWGLMALFTVVALQQVGFDMTAFLTGLGVLGFTVGFAIQDVSKNFVAGVLLLLQQPFDIGDAIQVGDYAGVVLNINLRATEMRTWDGRRVYIPNADVYTQAIINYTRTQARRIEITVGVAYDTDLTQAREAALEAVRSVPGVQEDPAPTVVFHTFGESSIDFTVYFWIDPKETGLWEAKSAAVQVVHRVFQEKGIEIPFPIRTVYLHQ
ncbi:MAG TPA: mechanosensitive ion channel [Anaerolineae bacterium]|nr:mechanosensitive ion channel [Anaerolineae bacterium]